MGGPHSEELSKPQELHDRGRDGYNAQADLRMRDLMARLASLPPEARTLAFKKFDDVLIEVFDLFSPPVFEVGEDELKRDLEHVERLEKAAAQRIGEASPKQGVERVSADYKTGNG